MFIRMGESVSGCERDMSPCKVGRAVCCVCVLWGKVGACCLYTCSVEWLCISYHSVVG